MFERVLIVGAGEGISASFARLCHREGMKVILAARNTRKLDGLVKETGAKAIGCDAASRESVDRLFQSLDADGLEPDLVLYNAGGRVRGPFVDLDQKEVETMLAVTAYGGFLVAQAAARRMLKRGRGTVLFTGASASVKGYAQSAPFAMGKFALRGLAQSMARELAPKGIHVAHFVIDGGVRNEGRGYIEKPGETDTFLDPDAIAETYLQIARQPRSAWTWEVELRPWVERF
jgi:short-subunit dehydrogenase